MIACVREDRIASFSSSLERENRRSKPLIFYFLLFENESWRKRVYSVFAFDGGF